MCIIIAKNKNNRLPSDEELRNSFEYNSDGAGFMYVDKNKVVIDKGYMTYKSFIGHYHKLLKKYNNFENKSLIIHCRIGTSGKNNKGTTHPYPITNNYKLLKTRKLYTDIGIAHNGIIRGYGTTYGLNDTQEYISKYLYPIYSHYPTFYKNNDIRENIALSTGSKFAILDTNERVYLVGDFINDNGLNFSNDTYLSFDYYKYYDKSYDKSYELDYYQDGYNDALYPLEKNWFVDLYDNGNTIIVSDKELWYDYETMQLFEYKDNDFQILSNNARVYDENYEEVF